jgi:hypothetical protein
MNHKEVTAEFMRDLEKIKATTLERLLSEYDRERRKWKINPANDYTKVYTIKTKAKNNWIIIIRKPYSISKYKNTGDTCSCCITYYHSKEGLLVLRHRDEENGIEAYWGHFFSRYHQRMHLNLSSMVDIIKNFFINSGSVVYHIHPNKNFRSTGICKEGFLFGRFDQENNWIINKTFVSKEIAFDNQNKAGQKIIQQFSAQLLMQLFNEDSDERETVHKTDMLLSFTGKKLTA